jgi:hypothetical protein
MRVNRDGPSTVAADEVVHGLAMCDDLELNAV